MTHTRSQQTIGRWTLVLLLALLLAACGGGESEQAAATPQEEEQAAATPQQEAVVAEVDTEVDTSETEEATESSGPACLVPDVVGFDQDNAERMVQGLGLQLIRSAEFSEDVPEGQVIEQEPAGDTRLETCEGEVRLVVSLGVEAEPTATATPTAEPTETATPTAEPTATIESTTEPTPAEEAETDEVAPTPDAAPAPPSEEGAANASEAFSIDLEPYEVGDFADELGTDLLIAERDGRKHLAGYTDQGRLELGGLSLSSNFELVFEADWGDFTQNIMLRSNTGEELGIRFEGRNISFGNTELRYSRSSWDGEANLIRLTVNNDTAKLYINDVFFGTTMVDPSLTYSELTISGINRGDALFAVSGTALQPRSAIEPGMVITTSDGRIATNIIPYQIGDIAVDLGTNLMIKERNGQKHITGYTDQGEFRLDNLSLSSNFELVFEADWDSFTQNAILRSSTGEEIGIRFEGRYISFGNTELRYSRSNWDGGANLIRLTVNNDTAKLYINEEFFGTASVDPALTYNNLIISGIKRNDALYSVMLIQNE